MFCQTHTLEETCSAEVARDCGAIPSSLESPLPVLAPPAQLLPAHSTQNTPSHLHTQVACIVLWMAPSIANRRENGSGKRIDVHTASPLHWQA